MNNTPQKSSQAKAILALGASLCALGILFLTYWSQLLAGITLIVGGVILILASRKK